MKEAAKEARELKADAGSYVHDVVEALILWGAGRSGAEIVLPVLPEHLAGAYYEEDRPVEKVTDWMIEGFLNFVADYQARLPGLRDDHVQPGLEGRRDARHHRHPAGSHGRACRAVRPRRWRDLLC